MRYLPYLCLWATLLAPRAVADQSPAVPAQKSNAEQPKLMPTSDDITNETASKIAEDQKAKDSAVTTSLREGGTLIRQGHKYHVIHSSMGILLVPATGSDVKPEDFDSALCSNGSEVSAYHSGEGKPKQRAETPEERMLVGVERPLSAKYTAYAGLIAKVIRKKCASQDPSPDEPMKVNPEVGVQWDNGDKSGGKNKVFMSPKGVGFGKSF